MKHHPWTLAMLDIIPVPANVPPARRLSGFRSWTGPVQPFPDTRIPRLAFFASN